MHSLGLLIELIPSTNHGLDIIFFLDLVEITSPLKLDIFLDAYSIFLLKQYDWDQSDNLQTLLHHLKLYFYTNMEITIN